MIPRIIKKKIETLTAIPAFAPTERPFSEGSTNLGKPVEVVAVVVRVGEVVLSAEVVLKVVAEPGKAIAISEVVWRLEDVDATAGAVKPTVSVAVAAGEVSVAEG